MDSSALYGYTNILSKESAVGLIMALGNSIHCIYDIDMDGSSCVVCVYTGNTGNSLRHLYSQIRVYFSHDGGFSWQEVMSIAMLR